MIINSNINRQICRVLKEKGYLSKRGCFHLTLCEKVESTSYNNDLYLCNDRNVREVYVYWGNIRRKRNYYDVYLSIVSPNEKYLAVVNNGTVEFIERM